MKTDYENHLHNYTLTTDDDGSRHAVNAVSTVSVLPDGESKLFQRRAIKGVGSGSPTFETVLVAELNGVRAYVRGGSVVLTTRDLKV